MKRLSLILGILISVNIWAASLSGTIKVEDSDSLGVFVYVEGQNKYDITDTKGKFKIDGLKSGEEYNVVLQKGNLPDYKKNVKLTGENTVIEIEIPKEKTSGKTTEAKENVHKETTTKETGHKETSTKETIGKNEVVKNKETHSTEDTVKPVVKDIKAVKVSKIDVSGKISSILNSDIFVQLSGQGYGIIVKPNGNFNLQLNSGKYTATFIQEGSITKKISFNVAKTDLNLGTIIMEALDYNSLTLKFAQPVENGVIQLYRDGFMEYSVKVGKNTKEHLLKGLKKGVYDLVVKASGKQDYMSTFNISGNSSIDVVFDNLNKENKIFVNIVPKDLDVQVRLLSGLELIRDVNVKDLAVLEGLEPDRVYSLQIISPKYKDFEIKRVVAGDNLDANLVREIKGSVITGFVSPFNSNAKVMLLDKGEILGETTADENGFYELELPNKLIGEKTLRVSAENFSGEFLTEKFGADRGLYEQNVMLKPYTTKISGKVTFGKGEALTNTLVMIEKLGIWQFTNNKGEYYFNNLDEQDYELTYKKLGYTTVNEKIIATRDEASIKNVSLTPIGKVVFRSNIDGYRLNVNGKDISVNQKIYEYIQGMGTVNISANKTGYLPVEVKINITEAGEIRDVFLDFINVEEQNKDVKTKIEKIKTYIKDLKITEAEDLLVELSQIKSLKSYEKEYFDIKSKISNAKLKLFDIDRSIKFEIEKVKDNIKIDENSKIGYVEKNKNLTKLYKESLDYLGKIILSHPYTTYRYDIHMLQSDIYIKMGMPNSSKASSEEAQKYENRRKE